MQSVPTILHADLDSFYASVEQLLDPSLRGRAIAVGGGGVVLAASYEAKRLGVGGAMPIRRAMQLCPHLLLVSGHFEEYPKLADRVMAIAADFTPAVERISIDEAFLDVSGAMHLFGPPARIGAELRRRVREEVGLPISVGAARTKHLAKVASQVAKPDGLLVVEAEAEPSFLDPLPVGLMWGVGPAVQRHLASLGIHTIGELARTPSRSVESLLGHAVGARLNALAVNHDPRMVGPLPRAVSIGSQSALGRTRPTPELVREVLTHLADRVASRLRAKHRAGRTVTVRVRLTDFRSVSRSLTLPAPIATTLTLREVAEQLVWRGIRDQSAPGGEPVEISLLAISVSNLAHVEAVQTELPINPDDPRRPGSFTGSVRWRVDKSMDKVRRRFGPDAVGYLPARTFASGIPDAYRELAEHDL